MYRDINAYTNLIERGHNLFRDGHFATSISLASGIARARDLRGEKDNVIAVIGDGAFRGGAAYEGHDFAGGEIEGNFIVLFNDNQMSLLRKTTVACIRDKKNSEIQKEGLKTSYLLRL